MDVIFRIIIVLMIFIILVMALIVWLWYKNPYYIVNWWNRRIKSECDFQDLSPLNGIPSYNDAWNSSNKTVIELHRLININHDDILAEVLETMKHYNGLPMNDLDLVQRKWLKNENRWRPIWVRFMNEWAGSANNLPTLKRIVSLFPDVSILHVSIFYPGTTLIEHRGPSRAVQRYHYGLQVPDGDVGLKIAGYDVKWKEKEGFVWDDTLPHSAWNHTDKPRIVIFADVFRQLSPINSVGSHLIYSLLQKTKHVTDIKNKLQKEGISID